MSCPSLTHTGFGPSVLQPYSFTSVGCSISPFMLHQTFQCSFNSTAELKGHFKKSLEHLGTRELTSTYALTVFMSVYSWWISNYCTHLLRWEEHPSSRFRAESQKQRFSITNLKLVIAATPLKTGYSYTDIKVLKMDCFTLGPAKLRFPDWTLPCKSFYWHKHIWGKKYQNHRRCNYIRKACIS